MKIKWLTHEEILAGYKVISNLYPHIPSISLWRAWEYAAYQHYKLSEPILDLGCGDGLFFKLLFPKVKDVVGVDMDQQVLKQAEANKVYKAVHRLEAHQLAFENNSFNSVFANCSLEHMNNLPIILEKLYACLKPKGRMLFSVVTDKFVEWAPLVHYYNTIGDKQTADALQKQHIKYHHVVNALTPSEWERHLHEAKFTIEEVFPIVPKLTTELFLLLDQLWHQPSTTGEELGVGLETYFRGLNNFPQHFGEIFSSLLKMEQATSTLENVSGLIYLISK